MHHEPRLCSSNTPVAAQMPTRQPCATSAPDLSLGAHSTAATRSPDLSAPTINMRATTNQWDMAPTIAVGYA
jgi:hypothetical protein